MSDNRKWFHCTTHAYGAWLPGDPRGFRTRHHREHVEGDYKNPPPAGTYDDLHARSRQLLKQPPVVFPAHLRPVIGASMRDELRKFGAQVLCVCVNGKHVHLLAKMPPGPVPRQWIGRAKARTTLRLKRLDWVGEVWAVRSKVKPIKDRGHQVNAFHYILKHEREGAWVWDFRADDQP